MAMAKKQSAGKKGTKSSKLIHLGLIVVSLVVILYFLGNYHFIRTSKRTVVVRKLHFGFPDTYVDMRKWSPLDLFYHGEVQKAIINHGGEKLLNQIQQGLTKVDP
ncbi:MAG: hypothetical protein QME64_00370 [bacterium]|nr:hypothetical protein [bacterium]